MTTPTPDAICDELLASVKPFDDVPPSNQSMRNIRVVNAAHKAIATIERLSAALEIIERGAVNDAFGKPIKITLFRMRSIARNALGKDAK